MILWEICSRQYPFEEYSVDPRFARLMIDDAGGEHFIVKEIEIRQAITEDHLRPTIPSGIPAGLKELISRCWDHSPTRRPSFKVIVRALSQLLGLPEEDENETTDMRTFCRPFQRQTHASVHLSALSLLGEDDPRRRQSVAQEGLFQFSSSVALPATCNPLCMVVVCGNVWCGCDTGDILIWSASEKKLLQSHRPHHTCIYSLLVVNNQVWSSSECYRIFIYNVEVKSIQNSPFSG
jgi:hypothetical protein